MIPVFSLQLPFQQLKSVRVSIKCTGKEAINQKNTFQVFVFFPAYDWEETIFKATFYSVLKSMQLQCEKKI